MDILSIDEVESFLADGAIIIDTRPSDSFVQGFIPRSINVPVTDSFKEQLSLFLEPDIKVMLLTEPDQEANITRQVAKTGFVNLVGIVGGGYAQWFASGRKTDLIIDIPKDEFEIDFNFDEFYLIDLREEDDYAAEHIEYSESIPISELEEVLSDLNSDGTYYLYADTFENSVLAASLFKRNGFHKLRVVNEGYEAIKQTNVPIAKKKNPKKDINFSAN